MKTRKCQIIDVETGIVEAEKEFSGEFIFQFTDKDNRRIRQFGQIHNALFGEKHEIKNWYYQPIARKLVDKFDELSHIHPSFILFIEDIQWEPPKGSKKRTWLARIKKADEWLKRTWQYRYVMEMRSHFVEEMSREQVIAMIYHELRHIDLDGDICSHDIEDWNNMVATLGANWATTRADIVDLLDEDFPGWDELRCPGQQLTLFRGGVGVSIANKRE